MGVAKRKCKVHKETPLVNEIVSMAKWCGSQTVIARTIGCSRSYVKLVLAMRKSTAHVFLSEETMRVLNEVRI